MDFKVIVALIAVAFSGVLFYQNQKRADMLVEMTEKYQSSVQKAQSAGAAAIMSDEALMEVIRASVKAEMAASPSDCSGAKFSQTDAAKFQDLLQKLVAFERKFNKAAAAISADEKGDLQSKLVTKATRLKEKIVALCKK